MLSLSILLSHFIQRTSLVALLCTFLKTFIVQKHLDIFCVV
uniref:Uncharacterized protein n=1 Tax=Anguilla anguilla TaxID=7936 RepID=A0A0E9UIB2_ANGAN